VALTQEMLEPHRAQALKYLDNMSQIVARERLVRGAYNEIKARAVDPDAPCGGGRFCAIGSLWIAADVPYLVTGVPKKGIGEVSPAVAVGPHDDVLHFTERHFGEIVDDAPAWSSFFAETAEYRIAVNLRNVDQETRGQELERDPALKLAYDHLNEAALAWFRANGHAEVARDVERGACSFDSALEMMFEGFEHEDEDGREFYVDLDDPESLLRVIDDARRSIMSAAPTPA
jgi:hypothetical protein